ncbi:LOW QUALITY PROTEIN: hypothetical protein TorRG33x02_157850 [Trema orientale]|uniref:Uncharacterized protein n=1 Tax=Trema orientale TaxID=63057 RepID=A0A2P5ES94_TREOI|nr:LOW QUALITY PROTEIN: hypothetical protein TorRG33x02_157850 [Trema orientale]
MVLNSKALINISTSLSLGQIPTERTTKRSQIVTFCPKPLATNTKQGNTKFHRRITKPIIIHQTTPISTQKKLKFINAKYHFKMGIKVHTKFHTLSQQVKSNAIKFNSQTNPRYKRNPHS